MKTKTSAFPTMFLLTGLLLLASMSLLAESPANHLSNENSKPKANIKVSLKTSTLEIPPSVLQAFYNSFIYDELGRFQGAYIGDIKNYASEEEIEEIVINYGVELQGTVIFKDYKPKGTRGCKANTNWICTLEGDVVDL